MKDKALLILNGPGLADLSAAGDRYGSVTLEQIQNESAALCAKLGMSLDCRQTDDQDEMFRWITKDSDHFDALIINPVGSPNAGKVDLGMYDSAIKKIVHLNKPVIEVHLTNIFRQGGERARTLQGPDGEMGFICGLGLHSYLLGIKAVARRLQG